MVIQQDMGLRPVGKGVGHGRRRERTKGRHRGGEDRPQGNSGAVTADDSHADECPAGCTTASEGPLKNRSRTWLPQFGIWAWGFSKMGPSAPRLAA